MVKRYVYFWQLLVVFGLGGSARLNAWAIEHIKNDLSYAIRIELTLSDGETKPIVLDIEPGKTVPFGYACPFEPDFGKGFDDFAALDTTLSVAPVALPSRKGYIAEGVYTGLRCPATFYYQEGSSTPRNYIIWHSLGFMNIRSHSYEIRATLRFYEKLCGPTKKGLVRLRTFCEAINVKGL